MPSVYVTYTRAQDFNHYHALVCVMVMAPTDKPFFSVYWTRRADVDNTVAYKAMNEDWADDWSHELNRKDVDAFFYAQLCDVVSKHGDVKWHDVIE